MKEAPIWQIRFYGTRGSTPVCEEGFQHFGGNTSCIYADLLINDRSKMILAFDAGTGIRKLGKDILAGDIPDTKAMDVVAETDHGRELQTSELEGPTPKVGD